MPLKTPSSVLIETVAGQLAACFYEVGRGQGLHSKHKNARAYARANLNKFIPKATEYLIEMLSPTSGASVEMKDMITEALLERSNDPELCEVFPNVDVKKVIAQLDIMEKKKVITINTEPKTVIHNG